MWSHDRKWVHRSPGCKRGGSRSHLWRHGWVLKLEASEHNVRLMWSVAVAIHQFLSHLCGHCEGGSPTLLHLITNMLKILLSWSQINNRGVIDDFCGHTGGIKRELSLKVRNRICCCGNNRHTQTTAWRRLKLTSVTWHVCTFTCHRVGQQRLSTVSYQTQNIPIITSPPASQGRLSWNKVLKTQFLRVIHGATGEDIALA